MGVMPMKEPGLSRCCLCEHNGLTGFQCLEHCPFLKESQKEQKKQ